MSGIEAIESLVRRSSALEHRGGRLLQVLTAHCEAPKRLRAFPLPMAEGT